MEVYQTEEYRGYDINIYYDSDPESPREWCNVATFVCEHRRYNLGDVQNIEGVVQELFDKYVSPEDIIKQFCENKNAKLVEDDDEKYYEYEVKHDTYPHTVCIPADDVDYCAAEMAESFSEREKLDMIEAIGEIVWLPISMYEHSGISIWLGGKSGHPDAQWDCSTIGFAYVEKCTAEKEGALRADKSGLYNGHKSWQEWAYAMMEGEMETYNQYVTGEVFGYMVEGGDGYCEDSCWGFFGTEEIPRMIEEAKAEIDYALEKQAKAHEANKLSLMQHIDECIGESWVFGTTAYRIGTDLFGQGSLERAKIVKNHVCGYAPCQVSDLDFDTLDSIVKFMNQKVA